MMMMMMMVMVRRRVRKRCMRARSEATPEDAFRSEALAPNHHVLWLMALLNRVSAVLRSNRLFKKHGKGGCDAMSVGAHVEQTCLKALIDLLGLGITWWHVETKSDVEIRWKAGNEPIGVGSLVTSAFSPHQANMWRHVTTISLKLLEDPAVSRKADSTFWPGMAQRPSPADLNGLRFQDDPSFIDISCIPRSYWVPVLADVSMKNKPFLGGLGNRPNNLKTPAVCKHETRFERTSGYPMLKNIEQHANFVTMLIFYDCQWATAALRHPIHSVQDLRPWAFKGWQIFGISKHPTFECPKDLTRMVPILPNLMSQLSPLKLAWIPTSIPMLLHFLNFVQVHLNSVMKSVMNMFHLNITITIYHNPIFIKHHHHFQFFSQIAHVSCRRSQPGGCRANQAPSSKLTSRRSKSHLLPMSMMTMFLTKTKITHLHEAAW